MSLIFYKIMILIKMALWKLEENKNAENRLSLSISSKHSFLLFFQENWKQLHDGWGILCPSIQTTSRTPLLQKKWTMTFYGSVLKFRMKKSMSQNFFRCLIRRRQMIFRLLSRKPLHIWIIKIHILWMDHITEYNIWHLFIDKNK